jgi:ribosomal protein S12 methylthiotransferase accessory factor
MLGHLCDAVDPLGYELMFFDATNDFDISAVVALALTLEDHMALYTLPEARDRYDYLLEQRDAPRPWQEFWPARPRPVPDLGLLLSELARGVAAAGMDVMFVDQTFAALRESLGLHAVKMVVPGAADDIRPCPPSDPGLPRLLEVPHRLGRVLTRPVYRRLPFYPHPFP